MVGFFLILFSYLLVFFGLNEIYSLLSQWSQYLFEFLFVLASFFYFHKKDQPQEVIAKFDRSYFLILPLNLVLGFLIYHGAPVVGATIPFNLSSVKIYLLLVIIAPILEELVFRHALFIPLRKLLNRDWIVIVISSLIFSYSHLRAIYGVSEAVKSFVIYQSVYTFIMALVWCHYRIKKRSLLLAILMHAFFNLGFGLAALF